MRHVDLQCVELARLAIGAASWRPLGGLFGNPNYMPHDTARVIKFPERRSELAKLRAEIEEMRKTVSVCAEAV